MTTLLITGASGFIGRSLAEQLACHYDVTAPTRGELDLCDEESAHHFFESHRFDVVLHAVTVRSNRLIGEPANLLADNLQRRPYVFERERVNFEYGPGEPLRSDGKIAEEKVGSTAGIV